MEEVERLSRVATDLADQGSRCGESEAYLAGCVLYAGALEAVYLALAHVFAGDLRSSGRWPESWTFETMVGVARDLGWLPSEPHGADETVRLLGELRDALRPSLGARRGGLVAGQMAYEFAQDVYAFAIGVLEDGLAVD